MSINELCERSTHRATLLNSYVRCHLDIFGQNSLEVQSDVGLKVFCRIWFRTLKKGHENIKSSSFINGMMVMCSAVSCHLCLFR